MNRFLYVDRGLAFTPTILRRLIERIDPGRYDESLAPDRFTLREVVAHMADFEPVIRGRMELALSHPGSEVQNWDQDAEALARNYRSWDVEQTLGTLANERLRTLELFGSLSQNQLQLTVKHPILGEMSIFGLAAFCLGHDTYHLEQVSQYLPA